MLAAKADVMAAGSATEMKKINLNQNWLFAFEKDLDCFNGYGFDKYADAFGAPARFYAFSNWQTVELPHDWAVALPKDLRADTSAGARPNTRRQHYMTERHSDLEEVFSVGWYRKHFMPEDEWQGKRVFLEFEGVFRDSMVWVNGTFMDRHTSGYTSFMLEITDHLVFGEENAVAVRVDSEQYEGWWYEGAGIYRNVFLHVAEPVYVKPRSTIIKTQLDGHVSVECTVVNDAAVPFSGDAVFAIGQEASVCVPVNAAPYSEISIRTEMQIASPRLWHVDHPDLYTLTIAIGAERHEEVFGVRTVGFDPDRGFLLNGQPFKLRGACVHQDFGGVGVALTDNLQTYKIRRLKDMGVNAYRCSHNAPAPALLKACDELGMLVMDETRLFGTSPEAVRQLTDVIERDRNHPCVFIWSLGNEEFSVQNLPISARLMEKMTRIAKTLDDTRPVTYSGNNGPDFHGANGAAEVRGVNYIRNDGGEGGGWLDKYHADHPHQPVIGTEESSYVLSRGGAATDLGSSRLDSSGLVTMMWGSTPKGWVKYFEERDYLAGSFMWTGFDYRGEPNPFITTNVSSSFGTLDLCGLAKPPFWYYKAWWTDEPVLQITPHWNHTPGDLVDIHVFTNCEQVTLSLNGRKLETQTVNRFDAPRFRVPFEPGVLCAEGVRNGQIIRHALATSGRTAEIRCRCELPAQNDGDIAIWHLSAYDENGVFCPTAMEMLEVTVENGVIAGVGNGDPASLDMEQLLPQEEAVFLRTFRMGDELYAVPPKAANHQRRRHDWLETEPAGNGFEDDVRYVAKFADNRSTAQTVELVTHVSGAEAYEYLEFERLGGAARVYLNGEEIGNTVEHNGRLSISSVRPYRFDCRFREGDNEIRVVSVQREFSDPPVSGYVKLGRLNAVRSQKVRLHYGMACVFIQSAQPEQVRVSAHLIQ